MPPRDDHEYEQRRQQIIDGALATFADKGFEKATNKDIAEAARIGSPGLIYHYFEDKIDLLHQVILSRMPLLQLLEDAPTLLDGPPEEALPAVMAAVMRAYNQWPAMAIAKVVLAESMRNPRVARMVSEIGPARGLRLLAGYLERQMDAGRLRRTDPHAAARVLVGPMLAYVVTRHVFEQPEAEAITPEAMARIAVDSFLNGMLLRPEGEPAG
jgi:TetR/AcrR family transcriptional repressor of mexJK operon